MFLKYTYGQPRAGNDILSNWVTAQGHNYRITHTSDAVPKLPPAGGPTASITGHYAHIAPEYWISKGTGTDGQIQVISATMSAGNAKVGNGGTGQTKFNILAHIQYFQNNMYVCAM
jgi:Lipase (class 3)